MAAWLSPALLLSQTCGLPFRAKLYGLVQLVATPDNQIPNCASGHYHSVILAHKGSAADLAANNFILAYNNPLSQTGGHAASAEALIDGKADIAAIDTLTWKFLLRDSDRMSQLTILTTTPKTPTLPYFIGLTQDIGSLRKNLNQAILSLDQKDHKNLQIFGLVDIKADKYLQLPLPPAP